MPVIVLNNVIKNYGSTEAVRGVSFQINEGEVFGLIGPDGAGKTSIMRMMVSLLSPKSGSIQFMDRDVEQNIAFVRSNIGYMPQRFSLYQDLSVEENLNFFGDLFNISANIQQKRLETLYQFSKLEPFKNRLAGALSGGMKQKLALSCMLMHEPKIMVLDEPTFGVDPVSRIEFWEILKQLRQQGITLVVSTPYMDEALRCDRIGLIYEGKILVLDKPQDVIKNFKYPLYRIQSETPHLLFNKLKTILAESDIQLFADGVFIVDREQNDFTLIQEKVKQLTEPSIEKIEPNLENVFLDLMHMQAEKH